MEHKCPGVKKGLAKALALLMVLELFVPGTGVCAEEISFVREQTEAGFIQAGAEDSSEIIGTIWSDAEEVIPADPEDATPSDMEDPDVSDKEDATPSDAGNVTLSDAENATPSAFGLSGLSGSGSGAGLYYCVVYRAGADAALFISNEDLLDDSFKKTKELIDAYVADGSLESGYVPSSRVGQMGNTYNQSNRPWVSDLPAELTGLPIKKVFIEEGTELPDVYILDYWFYDMQDLVYADLGHLDMSNASGVSMKNLFERCYSLTDVKNLPVGGHVSDLYAMFSSCVAMTELDLSEFETGSGLISFKQAFSYMDKLERIDISGDFYIKSIAQNRTAGMFSGTNVKVIKKGAFKLGSCGLTATAWYDEEDGKYTLDEFINSDRAGTYRTVFRKVTYDANLTSVQPKTESLKWANRETDKVKSAEELSFSNLGHHFNGWNTKPDRSGEYYHQGDLFRPTGEPELTLYAIWSEDNEPIPVELTLEGNGGSTPVPSSVTMEYGQSYYEAESTDLPSSVMDHYHITGWVDEDGREFTKDTRVIKDMTVHPEWEIDSFTVTFKNEDGAVLQSSDWDYGATPAYSAATPSKAATAQYTYTFKGWSPEITSVTGAAVYTATYDSTVNKYTVTFKNDDDTVLQSSDWDYGATPVYSAATPSKAATAQYTYTFKAWDSEIVPVTGAAVYTATYDSTVNKYTVTFKNDDDTVLQSSDWDYGATPAYSGDDPTKAATAQYTYTFKEWSPSITAVTGAAVYTATYDSTVNKYTVTFKNEDGTVLQSSDWDYGATPVYSAATPSKAATAQYTYTFKAWDSEIVPVTGAAVYTATYDEILNKYTVTFKNEDDTVLQSSDWDYGATPAYSAATPSKAATAQYTYTFKAWDSEIVPVTGAAVYTATYDEILNKYTVTFKNDDDTVLQSSDWDYGTTPAYSAATPSKAATAQYTYIFKEWSPEITSVTGAAVYTATYDSTVNKYTVTFKNDDDTVLQSSDWDYGATPVYSAATPSKAATAQYTYTFRGWSPSITAVTGAAVYTATYDSTVNKYTVTFKNEDGAVLQSSDWDYGATPAYSGDVPTKAATAQYTYTFKAWDSEIVPVTGAAVYTATYDSTVNKYTVTFKNEDGAVLQSSDWDYGTTPTYSAATPSKAATAQYTYTFKEWSPAVTSVTGAAVYTATYDSTVNKYTVTFKNEDGAVLQSSDWDYGATPAYSAATPSKAATAQYTYTFKAWDSEIVPVTGAAVYTATYDSTVNKYTVTFKNEDDTVLQSSDWDYGATPAYSAATPSKAATAQYTYTFKAWDSEIVPVTGAAVYTATYDSTVNKYTVTFKNDDDTVLQSSDWDYGATPVYSAATPSKAATAQYTYTFKAWDSEIVPVTGAAVYTATYDSTVNKYTVTFKNEDDTVLQSSDWDYGATPAYSGDVPTKAATAQYTYTFRGWSPAVTAVTGAAVYTATYDSTVNKYTVTFKNEDGAVLQSSDWDYGATPAYSGDVPTKAATAQYTYTFKAWDSEIVPVTGAAVYTATYDSTVNKYTVTFKNEDDTVLQSSAWDYGATPAYSGDVPTKAATEQYVYLFAGWEPEVVAVAGTAEYKATYTETLRQYRVSFNSNGGTAVNSQTVVYGGKISEPTAPTRAASDRYTYSFAGWYKELTCENSWKFAEDTVTSDLTLYAKWNETVRENDPVQRESTTIVGRSGDGNGWGGMGFSAFWYQDATGGWRIRDGKKQDIRSAWVCDDAYPANGKNAWYLIDANGYMVTKPLIRDRFGRLYCLNQEHRGLFGMMLFSDTYIGKIYVRFNQSHNGYFGAVIGEGIIKELLQMYDVYETDITDIVYTSSL